VGGPYFRGSRSDGLPPAAVGGHRGGVVAGVGDDEAAGGLEAVGAWAVADRLKTAATGPHAQRTAMVEAEEQECPVGRERQALTYAGSGTETCRQVRPSWLMYSPCSTEPSTKFFSS
jgi:hypothetical protein